jgi:hypothetical protein
MTGQFPPSVTFKLLKHSCFRQGYGCNFLGYLPCRVQSSSCISMIKVKPGQQTLRTHSPCNASWAVQNHHGQADLRCSSIAGRRFVADSSRNGTSLGVRQIKFVIARERISSGSVAERMIFGEPRHFTQAPIVPNHERATVQFGPPSLAGLLQGLQCAAHHHQ